MSSSSGAQAARVERSPESFESLQKRNEAVEILASYEKLSWVSYARRESLQQTRLHYQNIVAGFDSGDEAALVDWKTDNTPLPKRNGVNDDSARRRSGVSSGKGKERVNGGSVSRTVSGSSIPASPGANNTERTKDSSRSNDARKKRKSSGKT